MENLTVTDALKEINETMKSQAKLMMMIDKDLMDLKESIEASLDRIAKKNAESEAYTSVNIGKVVDAVRHKKDDISYQLQSINETLSNRL